MTRRAGLPGGAGLSRREGRWGFATGCVTLCVFAAMVFGACGRAADRTGALRSFLIDGPGSGTWEVQGLSAKRTTWIAPHPEDGAWLLKAEARSGSDARPCVALRGTVAREFLEGPWELFSRNYVLVGPERAEPTRDGAPAVHLRWVPRVEARDTARHVWFDADTGEVLQIEDVAREGQRVRGIYRVSTSTGQLDPERMRPGGSGGQDICMQSEVESIRMKALLELAPFPIAAPTWLPRGYVRIAARYEVLGDVRGPGVEPVRLASLLYSDGLGLISIGIAVAADMDALQDKLAAMGPGDGEPGGCSALPPGVDPVALGPEKQLRRRTDRCRTVLRLDGIEGVSVTLLCRNELDGDEYVKVMESLKRVTGP